MQPEQLGPYRIVRVLGHGGMGSVYEGIHTETDEPAAIKALAPGLADDPDFRQRFEAEIETLKKLYHPNIVQLFGFGEQDGRLFYAMELVDGSSLEEELRRGRTFSWREVARIGIDICRALRHAHDRGVTHRDIKPANLLLTRDGRVKLSDFGIAKLFGNTRLTATGNVLGTADYMAPEQADARPVGPKADLYSLGCVLYCLLARRPPFRARSVIEMLEKHRTAVPEPVSRYAVDVPREFELLIAQLLEKEPDKRVSNATLVARRLEAMLKALAPERHGGPQRALRELEREFELGVGIGGRGGGSSGPLPETRLAPPPSKPSAVPLGVTRPAEPLPETRATDAFQVYEAEEPQKPAEMPEKTQRLATGRFTVVQKEELDRPAPEPPTHPAWISPQTWILAGCLVAVGLGLWYMLQPPSADTLYQRIVTATADKSIDSFLQAEANIKEFLERYSNDSRAERLRGYMREIELYRLERQFELRSKGRASTEGLLPIERSYLEAINQAWLDPERGLAKLQALADLYQDRTDPSGPDGQCLDLVRRQMKRLRIQLAKSSPEMLAAVEERLKHAEELRNKDPERARAIWQALIALYGDKAWAAEAIQKAREALQANPSQPPPGQPK